MRKLKFVTGEYYHIYNRGAEKRETFLEDADFFRFLFGIRDMNTCDANIRIRRNQLGKASPCPEGRELVEVSCYCLMPNHFHFILQQITDHGISRFMQKLCTSYTMYFNLKYKRTGVLFQGPFQAKHIENNAYLLHLSRYIHLNPLDLLSEDEKDKQKISSSLIEYKWSSLQFYFDETGKCMLKLHKKVILNQFQDKEDFKTFVLKYADICQNIPKTLIIEK